MLPVAVIIDINNSSSS